MKLFIKTMGILLFLAGSPLFSMKISQDDELIQAIGKKEAAKAKSLIAQGANVNAKNKRGETALMLAATANEADIADLLIKRGASVTAIDKDGNTALLIAAGAYELDSRDVVKLLLENKDVNVNVKNKYGKNALMIASVEGFLEIVKHLLGKIDKNTINMRDVDGRTALNMVFQASWGSPKDRIEIAKLLINNGADVDISDHKGLTPLMKAALFGTEEAVDFLIKNNANVDATDNKGNTAFDLAVKNNNQGAIKRFEKDKMGYQLIDAISNKETGKALSLIAQGANVNAKNSLGQTVLMLAARRGITEVVNQLIKKGADLKATDRYGHTTLILGVTEGPVEVVAALLGAGVNLKETDKATGLNALMFAALADRSAMIDFLLNAGVDINAADQKGNTALMIAAKRGGKNALNALLKSKNLDINAKNNETLTALDIATKQEKQELVKLIKDKMKKDLLESVASNDLDKLKTYIANFGNKIPTEIVDKQGNNLLHIAMESGNFEIAQYLLTDFSQLKDVKNEDDETALMVGIKKWEDDPAIISFIKKAQSAKPKLLTQEEIDKARQLLVKEKEVEVEVK